MAARPDPPVRGYSFTGWSQNNPSSPHQGVQMDAEHDRSNAPWTQLNAHLDVSLATDGKLREQIVEEQNLHPDAFSTITQGLIDAVKVEADRAAAEANNASAAAGQAGTSATAADGSASQADSAATTAGNHASAASNSANSAQTSQNSAADSQILAGNYSNDAAGAASAASISEREAYLWAEYIAGPVRVVNVSDPDYHLSVDDGFWSAKWWALKAAGDYGPFHRWYLGAHQTANRPTVMRDHSPLVPGAMYYDLDFKRMMVWSGAGWDSFTAPMPAAQTTLLYKATAGQTAFSLAVNDVRGANYLLNTQEPYEGVHVHVNGKRFVLNSGVTEADGFTVDYATNTVTLGAGRTLDDLVQIDVLTPSELLSPGSATQHAVADIDIDWGGTGQPGQIDGTRTDFPVYKAGGSEQITLSGPTELTVYRDGVRQRPGQDYDIIANQTLRYADPPRPEETHWHLWLEPGSGGGGDRALAKFNVITPFTGQTVTVHGVVFEAGAVSGVTTLGASGTITAGGLTTTGAVSVGTTLGVTGDTTLAKVTATDLTVNGPGNITGALTVGSLSTAGSITAGSFNGTLNGAVKTDTIDGLTSGSALAIRAFNAVGGDITFDTGGLTRVTINYAGEAVFENNVRANGWQARAGDKLYFRAADNALLAELDKTDLNVNQIAPIGIGSLTLRSGATAQYAELLGGPTATADDGALIRAHGSTHANPGRLWLWAGKPAGSYIELSAEGAEKARVDASGLKVNSLASLSGDITVTWPFGNKLNLNDAFGGNIGQFSGTGLVLVGSAGLTIGNTGNLQTNDLRVSTQAAINTPNILSMDGAETGAFYVPRGTTAQRPAMSSQGVRYNTSDGAFEGWNGTAWNPLAAKPPEVIHQEYKGLASAAIHDFTTAFSDTDADWYEIEIMGLRVNTSGSSPRLQVYRGGTLLTGANYGNAVRMVLTSNSANQTQAPVGWEHGNRSNIELSGKIVASTQGLGTSVDHDYHCRIRIYRPWVATFAVYGTWHATYGMGFSGHGMVNIDGGIRVYPQNGQPLTGFRISMDSGAATIQRLQIRKSTHIT